MKGATRSVSAVVLLLIVSIHAPVKGATLRRLRHRHHVLVSIHAPVKGATSKNG